MTEKQKIERTTAEGFLNLFNARYETSFYILEHTDAPDFRCRDTNGDELNLETTLTEDAKGDITAQLGRSHHKSSEALKKHLKRVAEGKEEIRFSSLSGNVVDQVARKVKKKLLKRYGSNTALVVRDTSGVDWDWEMVIEDLKKQLKVNENPYDKGIWILNLDKTKLYQIVTGTV